MQLEHAISLNHDTKLFRFKLPAGKEYNVPVSSCLSCELVYKGQRFRRCGSHLALSLMIQGTTE